MDPGQTETRYAIQSVENALDVLVALGDSGEEFRICQLTQRLQMSKMRIFRLLATFERRGFIEKGRGGKYRLGAAAFELSRKLLLRLPLLRLAKPVMEGLAWKCNEAVYLGIRKGDEVLLLDMVDSLVQVKVAPLLGQRYPLDKVAAGLVILGEPSRGLDHDRDCDALAPDVASLAVPLHHGQEGVIGSLALVGPAFRFAPERLEQELLPSLKEAGAVISSKLGYLGSLAEEAAPREKRPLPGGPVPDSAPAPRNRRDLIL